MNTQPVIQLMDELPQNASASTTDRRIELKYQLTPEVAASVRQWAQNYLSPDENCGSSEDEYPVSTLYFDTPAWDIYYRRKDIVDGKHRVRRYGNESTLWLETKRKSNSVVRKKRTAIDEQEFNYVWNIEQASSLDSSGEKTWIGNWFRERVHEKQLRAAVVVAYNRFARVGASPIGPLRLTIDRNIRGIGVDASLPPQNQFDGLDLLPDAEILELKFTDHLPAIFKELLMDFQLGTSGFSKYRSAVSMSGLVS